MLGHIQALSHVLAPTGEEEEQRFYEGFPASPFISVDSLWEPVLEGTQQQTMLFQPRPVTKGLFKKRNSLLHPSFTGEGRGREFLGETHTKNEKD